ncbi:MAG: hypothetical protein MR639_07020 [Clostridium sp.]|uniref:hypothetical protein n=1 Tax=Clostridium sp. TaxID=1506 RepID=UPI002A8E6CB6|nr:hypothetical protein [Clostridium sp.]MDY5097740.1 hypothetical protein [Clostridium sp.]
MYIEEILLEKFQELERLRTKLIYDNDEEAQGTIRKIEDLELELGLLAKRFKDEWIKEEVDLEEYASIINKGSI